MVIVFVDSTHDGGHCVGGLCISAAAETAGTATAVQRLVASLQGSRYPWGWLDACAPAPLLATSFHPSVRMELARNAGLVPKKKENSQVRTKYLYFWGRYIIRTFGEGTYDVLHTALLVLCKVS